MRKSYKTKNRMINVKNKRIPACDLSLCPWALSLDREHSFLSACVFIGPCALSPSCEYNFANYLFAKYIPHSSYIFFSVSVSNGGAYCSNVFPNFRIYNFFVIYFFKLSPTLISLLITLRDTYNLLKLISWFINITIGHMPWEYPQVMFPMKKLP